MSQELHWALRYSNKQDRQLKKVAPGTSVVVQWLRLCISTAVGTGLIPVKKLRFHILCGVAKKKKTHTHTHTSDTYNAW